MKLKIRHAVDKALEKAVSRKLLVWATATGLTLTGNLESADWVIISAIYLGSQGIIDAIVRMKGYDNG
tara:strand:+ start:416 stop:619 length:204 start_codon:yes stop_codon:yes gene_type:complete